MVAPWCDGLSQTVILEVRCRVSAPLIGADVFRLKGHFRLKRCLCVQVEVEGSQFLVFLRLW